MGVLIVCGLSVRQMCLTRQFLFRSRILTQGKKREEENGERLKRKQTLQGVKNNGCSHSVWAVCQTNVSDMTVSFHVKEFDLRKEQGGRKGETKKKTNSVKSKE